MIEPQPADVYRLRGETFDKERARHEGRARLTGNLNLLLFFGAAVTLTVGAVRSDPLWYWLAAALTAAFVVGLAYLQRVKGAVAYTSALVALNREGLARLERNWAALPPPPRLAPLAASPEGTAHIDPATAADLDLLGPASLQHLLNTPATPIGQSTLHTWLQQIARPAKVAVRQEAAVELGPLNDFRDTLAAQGRQMNQAQEHYERFVAWAESAPWLAQRTALLWAARLLPLLALLLTAAAWYRWPLLAGLPLLPLLGAVLLVILTLALTAGNRAAAIIGEVEAHESVFGAYAHLFDLVEQQPFRASELRRLQGQLGAQRGSHPAASPPAGQPALDAGRQMRGLERLMPLASIRRWMLFLPVELFTLWNIHLLWLLERWKRESGPHVRGWLAALGEIEALAALATLHHDHPSWRFPTFQAAAPEGAQVRAADLAHPLLPPAKAVGNDVTVGPPGTFLLVTGSNMSGKSTLLRAIGLNCVLAQMGAPVCAESLVLPPVRVASSMRVQDSLAAGVSYFLAELQSLKAIVDVAERKTSSEGIPHPEDADPLLLYLLDEILQGTNSAERQIAARHIIRRLVDSQAIGAVSTHDLTLAAAPELVPAAVSVHFTESFSAGGIRATGDAGATAPPGADDTDGADRPAEAGEPAMHFDYKLRPGVATSTNALKLMQVVGLFSPHGPHG